MFDSQLSSSPSPSASPESYHHQSVVQRNQHGLLQSIAPWDTEQAFFPIPNQHCLPSLHSQPNSPGVRVNKPKRKTYIQNNKNKDAKNKTNHVYKLKKRSTNDKHRSQHESPHMSLNISEVSKSPVISGGEDECLFQKQNQEPRGDTRLAFNNKMSIISFGVLSISPKGPLQFNMKGSRYPCVPNTVERHKKSIHQQAHSSKQNLSRTTSGGGVGVCQNKLLLFKQQQYHKKRLNLADVSSQEDKNKTMDYKLLLNEPSTIAQQTSSKILSQIKLPSLLRLSDPTCQQSLNETSMMPRRYIQPEFIQLQLSGAQKSAALATKPSQSKEETKLHKKVSKSKPPKARLKTKEEERYEEDQLRKSIEAFRNQVGLKIVDAHKNCAPADDSPPKNLQWPKNFAQLFRKKPRHNYRGSDLQDRHYNNSSVTFKNVFFSPKRPCNVMQ